MPGLYTGASGLWGGFAGLLYGSTSLSTPPGLLADAAGFSPSSLFANGEQGVWYQNSDFSTLFQDAAGTTPVTALEQPVGLRLDKSKGLVLGSELVTNGDFSNGTTGWALTGGGSWSVSGGVATINAISTGSTLRQTIASVVVGRWYAVSYDIISVATNTLRMDVLGSGANWFFYGPGASGRKTVYVVAQNTTFDIACYGNTVASIDNISVRELPGNHASQATSASRPVLSARYNLLTYTEQFDNAAWTKSGATIAANATTAPDSASTADKLVEAGASGSHQVYSGVFTTVTGSVTYSVRVKAAGRSWVFLADNTGGVYFNVGNGTVGTASGGRTGTITADANGFYVCSVTGSWSGTQQIYIVLATGDGTTSYTGDGTSGIYIWGADLRAASESPALPVYQRVGAATYGTSTVAGNPDYDTVNFPPYLIYDGGDWFQTNSINFTATDKMSVFAGVRKLSDANEGSIVELSDLPWFRAGVFNIGSSVPVSPATSNYSFGVRQTAFAWGVATSYAAPKTDILTGLFDIGGAALAQEITPRVDAVSVSLNVQDAGPAGSGNFGNWPLYFGTRGGSGLFFNGRDYGFVIVGRAVTASELTNTEDYMDVQTFGKNMTLVYSDELTTALGELITAADGDQIYMSVSYV